MKTHLRYFIILFSWRSYKILQNYTKKFMWRMAIALEIHQQNFVTTGARKSWIINCNFAICSFKNNFRNLFKLEDDFGQVIKKTKVNVNFLFKLRFHLNKVEKKQHKIKLKKLPSLSPNSVYTVAHWTILWSLPHFRFKLNLVTKGAVKGSGVFV